MMGESSDSVNTNTQPLDSSEHDKENNETDLKNESTEKGLLDKINLEKLAEKLGETNLKSKSSFDSEKWTKICKITRNILLANLKQYNTEENKKGSSSLMPLVLSNTLKLPSDYTPSETMPSLELWDMNTLEFISLSSAFKTQNFSLSFKLINYVNQRVNKQNENQYVKQKLLSKTPPITIQGKQFKYDSAQLISLIQKSQRQAVYEKAPPNDPKQRVLEKFNLKGEVKIPPNWDRKVAYENPSWDMPSTSTGSIFSLGVLKNENKGTSQIDMESAATALKNLSTLASDFQVSKKNQPEGSTDDLGSLNMTDINNFVFVDDDLDDSLKCSRFSKFFKVLKDQQDNQD